ncbi:MAG: hypothetical protein V7749_08895 [Cocleimonas sp.]
MFNQSRRTFIKGVAYSSALAAGGISGLAMATTDSQLSSNNSIRGSALPTCDISIAPHQSVGTEIVTLTNHTSRNVRFDSISGVGLEHVNKDLTVKVNKIGKHAGQDQVTLAPGEQLSFVVAAISCDDCGNANNQNLFIPNMLAGQLTVKSNHPDFNGVIPLTVFETA